MLLIGNDGFRHPNVVALYGVYHSCTHLLFRNDYGGPEELYRRLAYREKDDHRRRPFSAWAARQIALEVVAGDTKPENIIVREGEGDEAQLEIARSCARPEFPWNGWV